MPGEPTTLGSTSTPDVNAAFASHHPGGAHFVFGDGHVALLTENMGLPTYQALSTREDKDLIGGTF
jgi:prepilin-type processing-associated H-X9-DG protein